MRVYATAAAASRQAAVGKGRPCRHCCQPIAARARICQHCHNYQGFFGGERDPRGWLLAFAIFLAAMGGLYVLGNTREPPELTVSDVSSRVVAPTSATEAGRVEVSVNHVR